MGQKQQTPPDQRKEEPIIGRHIHEIDHDQQGIHRDIERTMDEEAPHPRVGEDRFVPPGALKQEREVVGGDADAPAWADPTDEPDMIGIAKPACTGSGQGDPARAARGERRKNNKGVADGDLPLLGTHSYPLSLMARNCSL